MTKRDPNPPVSVSTDHIGLVPVTSIAGEIDISTDELIRDEVHTQLAMKPDVLVLDLTSVVFMGSAGLNLLVQSQHEATRLGTRLAVVACEGMVRQVIDMAGIDQVIDLYSDVSSLLRTV